MSVGRFPRERSTGCGSLHVTSAALDRASLLRPLGIDGVNRRPRSARRILGHVEDLRRGMSPEVLRGKSTIVSLASDRRAFELADHLAMKLVEHLVEGKVGIEPHLAGLASRHREATRFLVMHDFVGLLRPLVEASDLARPKIPKFPRLEILARRAVAELEELPLPRGRPTARAQLGNIGPARLNAIDEGRRITVSPAFVRNPAFVGDIVIELSTDREPTTSHRRMRVGGRVRGACRAFRLLRASNCPPALSMLLSRATDKILAGRLESLCRLAVSDRDLSPLPVAYWSSFSLRSVFHASERRARGLPTIGLLTILTSDHPRYRCDVFDGFATVGTGQVIDGFGAYRLPGSISQPDWFRGGGRRAMIALQPAIDIVEGLAKFARLASANGWQLSVRSHPTQQRDPTIGLFWQRLIGSSHGDMAANVRLSGQLVVTGLSSLAIEACLAGCPVVLVCSHPIAAALWPRSPPPGRIVDPAMLECSSALDGERLLDTIVAEARAASARFVEHFRELPELH